MENLSARLVSLVGTAMTVLLVLLVLLVLVVTAVALTVMLVMVFLVVTAVAAAVAVAVAVVVAVAVLLFVSAVALVALAVVSMVLLVTVTVVTTVAFAVVALVTNILSHHQMNHCQVVRLDDSVKCFSHIYSISSSKVYLTQTYHRTQLGKDDATFCYNLELDILPSVQEAIRHHTSYKNNCLESKAESKAEVLMGAGGCMSAALTICMINAIFRFFLSEVSISYSTSIYVVDRLAPALFTK